jgi:hypothetical protein
MNKMYAQGNAGFGLKFNDGNRWRWPFFDRAPATLLSVCMPLAGRSALGLLGNASRLEIRLAFHFAEATDGGILPRGRNAPMAKPNVFV